MGACSTKPAAQVGSMEEEKLNKDLERTLRKEHETEVKVIKLLLLGAGESGKSTLFKQMLKLYGTPLSVDDRRAYRPVVHSNIISSMQTLVHEAQVISSGENGRERLPECAVSDANRGHAARMLAAREREPISPALAASIQALWADPGIQATYRHRNMFQLTDSAAYFFRQLDTVAASDYLPTVDDVMRARVRTTGIVENKFEIQGNQFAMFDVGGQRNERKKWIHCFDKVRAVLFVAALSEYDLKLFEDESTNRMQEALRLFEEVCRMECFRHTSIILLLNKRDIFAEKIATTPLVDYVPEYDGPLNDPDDAAAFIEEMFRHRFPNSGEQKRELYSHITCATDQTNVDTMFSCVKDIVVRGSLIAGGLMN